MGLFSRKKRETTESVDGEVTAEATDPGPAALAAFDQLLDREWERLANAGTWWTGGERVAIAADARLASVSEKPSGVLPPPIQEATRRIAAEPAGIRDTDVARWELEGLDPFAYIEVTGIVSRLMALDTASFGLGRSLRELPDQESGEPSRVKPAGAMITTGWAPTIGPATAPGSLSAVPAEAEAMFDLHDVLYATMDQMFEMQLEREGLKRPQIELVAARTSRLNECFY
jgi:hypothetical protein